jgi:branched-subunit amino acid aminotransferase/4-amino-4-deoxychorismate lyase
VETAADTLFANPYHYGAGFFEGIRLYDTPNGPSFIELPSNMARFVFSSLALNPSLIGEVLKLMNNENIDHLEHTHRTPREFFADAAKNMDNGKGVRLSLSAVYKNGSRKKVELPVTLKVMFPEGEREITMKEMATAMCSIAFLNKLVRLDSFPADVKIVPAGYFRPFAWVSGEQGLRVPTLYHSGTGALKTKPFCFAIGTLPWGTYLPAEDYVKGLDILVAPLPRIDESMAVERKISGAYVNSAMNINLALLLGFGEILATNHSGKAVEGSAENLVFLFTDKSAGELIAYSPPLSSNILVGTTRDRIMRILDAGIEVNGRKVTHILVAPELEFILDCLKGKSDSRELSAIVMVGTGVNIIHVKSVTYNPALIDWLRITSLQSEARDLVPVILRRPDETKQTFLINNGQRHPFVSALQKAYADFVIQDNGALLTPVYSMDMQVAARLFGVELRDAASREFIQSAQAGRYEEKVRVNGLLQPTECMARFREVGQVIKKMAKLRLKETPARTNGMPARKRRAF